MSNLEKLIGHYQSVSNVVAIAKLLQDKKKKRVKIDGLIGAQGVLVCHAVQQQISQPIFYIASDKEAAAYFYSSLSGILDASQLFFLPDSFKRPSNFEEVNKLNIQQRTEIINNLHIGGVKQQVIVTYPEALFEKVVNPEELEGNKIELKVGESCDIDTIIEILVDFGFKREDFVYEPGQFSIRGGIVDIFSFGNEWPYRIELFDDEVESIRTFNPMDQLSTSTLSFLSIVPNIHLKFDQSQKISVFSILPESTNVWIENLDSVINRLQTSLTNADKFAKTLKHQEEDELTEIFRDRSFIDPNNVINELDAFDLVIHQNAEFKVKYDKSFDFNTQPQPSFNKNFTLLIEDLTKKTEEGYTNYICTDNARQIERFYNIFEDLEAKHEWHPVKVALHQGFIDPVLKIACYTDHQIFDRFHKYKIKRGYTKDQSMSLKMLRELKPGDFVTHIDHGIGRYSGLEKININGTEQESVRLIYHNNDILYVGINSLHKISRYVGKDGTPPKLHKIGGDAWKTVKARTKKRVKDIAKELIKLYAQRKASKGFAFPQDGYLQNELEASFLYEDTPDQYASTVAVKEDMQKPYPMDRLICGDVGFGKTEVAIRATFKAVIGGKQVAILVPTTILALQHSKTFKGRLEEFGVTVDYINRFRTSAEKTAIYKRLKDGEIDVVIGTHALLNKKVGFKDLGLLVIDEEQKFGVAAKEKLRNFKVNVDTLTLTATPIPRTLQFSLMAARDLSVIRTAPPNRQPIHTERRVFSDQLIKESIYYEFYRGGQVFFVHNRVKSLPEIYSLVKKLCPDVEIGMAHGQLEAKALEKTLNDFIQKKFDVLVCTNIIETGLDIANANTIIINNAHQFGMSDLHQLRGRVGRSNKKAFCYLFTPPISVLTSDARKRIKTLEEFSDLGSGFHIAMKDLDIRGAGNLLGGEQSGFIADIGYETYQKILEEAILELKENEFKELFKDDLEKDKSYVRDVEVDTDIEMLIPDDYISVIQERLNLYQDLDKIKNEEELEAFIKMMKDRFGPLPSPVKQLFHGIRVRWVSKQLGFDRVSLKSRKLRCYFVSNAQSPYYESDTFKNIMQFVTREGTKHGLSLKQSRNHLIMIKDGVKELRAVRILLENLENVITPTKASV